LELKTLAIVKGQLQTKKYFYSVRRNKSIVLEKVLVEDYAAEGKSLARWEGKVIFIENVVPGDIVDIRLRKNKKDWAEGYPIQFHSYSKQRVQPFCQHFGVCGGCQWQMLPYNLQLVYKQQQVYDNLKRIGKIPLPQFLPIAGAHETKFYRNKLEYTFSTKEYTPEKPNSTTHYNLPIEPIQTQKQAPTQFSPITEVTTRQNQFKQETFNNNNEAGISAPFIAGQTRSPQGDLREAVLGFHAKGFFDKVVNIQKCWLQHEPTNELRNSLRDFAKKNEISFYDIRAHKGLLRNMQVRVCTTGEIMVNVIFGEDKKKEITKILEFIAQQFPQITTLLYTINLKMNDSLQDQQPIVYKGKGHIIEKLENFEFKIGPKSFFQTNTKQAEKLYQITRDFAELNGSQVVYDLYCGTGSIGIFCSKRAKKIIGVEAIEEAVSDAKENAILNKIDHAQFFKGDVVEICNDVFFAEHGQPDVLITDPPRAGMHEKLVKKILEIEAPLVVYVSCNPATQARDLNLLDEKYMVTKVQPVDMFPHTHHIENVVQLKLKRKD
jgi:23S rRNA (uracil1939-C5)-methyltransferase